MTETDAETHSQTLNEGQGLLWRRIGGRINSPEGDRNSTGRPTESTNLNPWGSQRLNHQPKSINVLEMAS